jgi:hypothetical protein
MARRPTINLCRAKETSHMEVAPGGPSVSYLALAWAHADAASRAGVSRPSAEVVSLSEILLSSSSDLDVPEAGLEWPAGETIPDPMPGLDVMTRGFRIVVVAAGRRFVYHANGSRVAFAGIERDLAGPAKTAPTDSGGVRASIDVD